MPENRYGGLSVNEHCEVFISYRSCDLAFAEEVYERLTAAGFSVWFDKGTTDEGEQRLMPGPGVGARDRQG